MSTISIRHDMLVRTTELKAAIVALLNREDKKLKTREIETLLADKLIEIGANEKMLPNHLYNLAKNKVIGSAREGRHSLYFRNGLEKSQNLASKKIAVKVNLPKEDNKGFMQANIKMLVSKSTGNIKFLMKGITIEIGVEE